MEHSVRERYEMRAIVKGKVQGVGFRAMTRYYAMTLGIPGTVCNLLDGSVEIFAQGSKRELENFILKLKENTNPGQIEEINVGYASIKHSHDDFKIIP